MKRIMKWLEMPAKFKYLNGVLGENSRILDVGCGNNSSVKTKKLYPSCVYHGLNQTLDSSVRAMDRFYKIDLKKLESLKTIPNNYYDCVILCQVIEHLLNGYDILTELIKKLKSNGILYIETPSRMGWRLFERRKFNYHYTEEDINNFAHVKFYPLEKMKNVLVKNNLKIIKSSFRILWRRVLFLPIYVVGSFVRFGRLKNVVFWDITAYSVVLIGRK